MRVGRTADAAVAADAEANEAGKLFKNRQKIRFARNPVNGQGDGEQRPLAAGALGGDVAAVALDDAVAYGQAQACALHRGLG